MPAVQLKHSFGELTLMGPREPPKCTPNGSPPDFQRNTSLYGIDRFVSMRTLELQHRFGEPTLMGPGRAPKGNPKWGPTRLPAKYIFVWYRSIRLDAYSQFTTSSGEPTIMGPHRSGPIAHPCLLNNMNSSINCVHVS